jgi:predicted kinase
MRSDIARKRLSRVGETTRHPPESYTAESSAQVYDRLLEDTRQALVSGMSVIVDAVFSKPEERQNVEDLARAAALPFVGIWLEAPLSVKLSRVSPRVNDASDADATVVEGQSHYTTENIAWRRCDAGRSYDETLRQALAALTTRMDS